MNDPLRLDTLDRTAAATKVEALVACYLDVYRDSGPFHSEERFRKQLAGHMDASRWQAVTATSDDGELVGYLYGFALGPSTRWWEGLATEVEDGFVTEDGDRTAVVSELLVRAPYRRRGIAADLHDQYLTGRTERRVTLLVESDNTPAYSAYRSWGYQTVAKLRPAWEHAPLFDVMIMNLPPPLGAGR